MVIIDLQTIIIVRDKTVGCFSFIPRHGRNVRPPPSRRGKTVRCGSRPPEYRSARFASATSPRCAAALGTPIRPTNGRRPCAVPSPFDRIEIHPETRRRTPVNVALENTVVFDPIRPWRTERSRKSRPTDRFASARRPPHGRECLWSSVSVSRTASRRTLSGGEGDSTEIVQGSCEKVTFKKHQQQTCTYLDCVQIYFYPLAFLHLGYDCRSARYLTVIIELDCETKSLP